MALSLKIGDSFVNIKSAKAKAKHAKRVEKMYDELLEASQTKTRKVINPDYKEGSSEPRFFWKDTPPKQKIMQIRIGKTTMRGTYVVWNEKVTSEYPIKDERTGKVVRTIIQKGSPGKLCRKLIGW